MLNLIFLMRNIIECDNMPNKEIRFFNNTDFSIDSCFFTRNYVYIGSGGIIYCQNIQSRMILKDCIFLNCKCSESGGAIHFVGDKEGSQFNIYKTCASICSAPLHQFAYISTYKTSDNEFNFTSINKCNILNTGYYSLDIKNGKLKFSNLNSSKNNNLADSSISIIQTESLFGSFCTISDNNSSSVVMNFNGINSNNIITNFNIVNNDSPYKNSGVIYFVNSQCSISNSILLNNQDILFYVESGNGQVKIENCVIFHKSQVYQGNIISFQVINQLTNTFLINHFNTYSCNSNLSPENSPTREQSLQPTSFNPFITPSSSSLPSNSSNSTIKIFTIFIISTFFIIIFLILLTNSNLLKNMNFNFKKYSKY